MRMNISVPDDLRKRMDRVSKKNDVNWSAIACRAFADQCLTLESRQKEIPDMADVLSRLRGLDQAEKTETEIAGFAAGAEWAKATATPKQLRRLAKARDRVYDWSFHVEGGAYTSYERFYFIVEPESDEDRHAAESFWEEALGDEEVKKWEGEQNDFVHGFTLGAMSIWEQVEGKL
jgi:hypothetical protein